MSNKNKDRTTLWISDNMWFRLNHLKQKGQTFEEVIDHFIPKETKKSFWIKGEK